jgi:uncharacterized membrane protein YbaN (DUF454 family)
MKSAKNLPYLILGHLFLALGFIGIFLPLLPTTPFILLSAFCYSKGSAKMHNWLMQSKFFGHLIADWNKRGAINLRAKIISTLMILILFSYTLIFVKVIFVIKIIVGLTGLFVLGFILTRPN